MLHGIFLLPVLTVVGEADTAPVLGVGTPLRITLPNDGDDYSKLVARAAAHDATVDFHTLRFAYLKSVVRQRNGGIGAGGSQKDKMLAAERAGDDTAVRGAAEDLLSIKYIDLGGQALLGRACQRLHDSACAAQADFVARGLLRSIMDTGDGKTCRTGWEVAAVDEEYIVLSVLGAKPKQQSLVAGSPSCDVWNTSDTDGKASTYFFRIDALVADEMRVLKQK